MEAEIEALKDEQLDSSQRDRFLLYQMQAAARQDPQGKTDSKPATAPETAIHPKVPRYKTAPNLPGAKRQAPRRNHRYAACPFSMVNPSGFGFGHNGIGWYESHAEAKSRLLDSTAAATARRRPKLTDTQAARTPPPRVSPRAPAMSVPRPATRAIGLDDAEKPRVIGSGLQPRVLGSGSLTLVDTPPCAPTGGNRSAPSSARRRRPAPSLSHSDRIAHVLKSYDSRYLPPPPKPSPPGGEPSPASPPHKAHRHLRLPETDPLTGWCDAWASAAPEFERAASGPPPTHAREAPHPPPSSTHASSPYASPRHRLPVKPQVSFVKR